MIGAIFTPPDVISQLLLAIPLWLLYEVGLFVARFVSPPQREADGRRRRRTGDGRGALGRGS